MRVACHGSCTKLGINGRRKCMEPVDRIILSSIFLSRRKSNCWGLFGLVAEVMAYFVSTEVVLIVIEIRNSVILNCALGKLDLNSQNIRNLLKSFSE